MRGGGKGGGTAPAVTLDIEPGEDPFGIEPAMRQLVLPAVRFLHDRYWRVEVSGAHHLPASGPALLLANHSGAIPFDGAMIVTAVELQRARTLRFSPAEGDGRSRMRAEAAQVRRKVQAMVNRLRRRRQSIFFG